jgi:hypothetical protein
MSATIECQMICKKSNKIARNRQSSGADNRFSSPQQATIFSVADTTTTMTIF